jgi:hypothetical protein
VASEWTPTNDARRRFAMLQNPRHDLVRGLRHRPATCGVVDEGATAEVLAARVATDEMARQLQEAFSGSSNSSAEAAVEASQRALPLLEDVVGALTQASAELARYIGDVLGELPDTTPAPRERLDDVRGAKEALPRPAKHKRRPQRPPPQPDEKVSEILRRKQGSIKNAPLGRGSPSWDDLSKMDLREIEAGARANRPGYKTALKLLRDRRFDR